MEDRSQVAAIIEELKRLDGQIDSVADLVALKPIFYRIEEINREHPTDFEVQLLISDVKQHLVNRGTLLKQQPGGAARTVSGTAAVPAQQAGVATKSDPSIWAATGSTPAVPSSIPEPPLAAAPPFPPVTPHIPEKASGERQVYIPPARTQPPPPPPAAPAVNWKKPVLVGVIVGLVVGLAVLGTVIVRNRPKPKPPTPVVLVPLRVTTVPPGAAIRVDGQSCTSECNVNLKPGQYKLMAELPGYQQDFRDITAAAGQPITLNLTLAPQPQGLRIVTDFGSRGQVLLDDKPAGTLQDGQLTLDSVAEGKHSVRIAGRPGQEVKFDFEVKPGAPAVIDGPVTAKSVVAVVASRFGKQLHVQANQNQLKVSLDGAPKGETTANGIDIGDVPEGDRELTLSDGKTPDQKLVVPASASPVMAVWVVADTSTGTLVVNTGEDGATVLIDNKPYPRKTKRGGQITIPGLQPKDYKIKVTKTGFQDVPEQTATIKGGGQSLLTFTLKAVPTVAVLHVKSGMAGADVYVDKEHVGIIDNDGSFQYPNVAPGEHTIEIRKEGFTPKTHRWLFAEGQTVELPPDAVTLQPANGSVKITVVPENAQITVKYPDGRTQRMQAGTHPLPVGSYTISAAAPGFKELSKNVQVNSGDTAPVELKLTRETTPVNKPVASKPDWERPEDWKKEDGWMVHRGAGFVPFGAQPSTGVYTFSAHLIKGGLLSGKRVQWYVGYVDNKNYTHCQLDKKSFQCAVVTNGKRANKPKKDLNTDETFTVLIDIAPDSVTHKLRENDKWITIDTLNIPNVGAGKFGFLVTGNDGLAISNFTYTPK